MTEGVEGIGRRLYAMLLLFLSAVCAGLVIGLPIIICSLAINLGLLMAAAAAGIPFAVVYGIVSSIARAASRSSSAEASKPRNSWLSAYLEWIKRVAQGKKRHVAVVDVASIGKLWDAGNAGQAASLIYDSTPITMRPAWAADILDLSCSRLRDVPAPVRAVIEIGRSPSRFREGDAAFSAVRKLTLVEDESHAGGGTYLLVLVTAENAAKVIYNASGVREPIKPPERAPFDEVCGNWLVRCLRHLADASDCPEFKRAAWSLLESWLCRGGG